jgi:outer membrane biosynthesis protein TonB
LEEHNQQSKEKEKKEKKEKSTLAPQKKEEVKKVEAAPSKSAAQPTQESSAKILERMTNQNTYDEVIQGFIHVHLNGHIYMF